MKLYRLATEVSGMPPGDHPKSRGSRWGTVSSLGEAADNQPKSRGRRWAAVASLGEVARRPSQETGKPSGDHPKTVPLDCGALKLTGCVLAHANIFLSTSNATIMTGSKDGCQEFVNSYVTMTNTQKQAHAYAPGFRQVIVLCDLASSLHSEPPIS